MPGKKAQSIIVLAIILVLIAVSIVSWLPAPEVSDYVRTSLTIVLLWFLYAGKAWAKWIVGILCAVTGLLSFFLLFRSPLPEEALFIFLGLGILSFLIAFVLLSPVLLDGYFSGRRHEAEPASRTGRRRITN